MFNRCVQTDLDSSLSVFVPGGSSLVQMLKGCPQLAERTRGRESVATRIYFRSTFESSGNKGVIKLGSIRWLRPYPEVWTQAGDLTKVAT